MSDDKRAGGLKAAKRGRQKKAVYIHAENLALAFVSLEWKVQPAVRAAVDMILKGKCSDIIDMRPIDGKELRFESEVRGARAVSSERYLAKAKEWRENFADWGEGTLPPQTQYDLSPEDSVIRYICSEVRKRLRK